VSRSRETQQRKAEAMTVVYYSHNLKGVETLIVVVIHRIGYSRLDIQRHSATVDKPHAVGKRSLLTDLVGDSPTFT
jgi:RNA-splicing ligase RtcB